MHPVSTSRITMEPTSLLIRFLAYRLGLIGYLTNLTMVGYTAEQFKGATVLLEHRFFGESNPYLDLSVKSFRVHADQRR